MMKKILKALLKALPEEKLLEIVEWIIERVSDHIVDRILNDANTIHADGYWCGECGQLTRPLAFGFMAIVQAG